MPPSPHGRCGDIVDPALTVPELVARGYTLGDAIAARAFVRWIALMGPADGAPASRAAVAAAELGVAYYELERVLVAYASGVAGADRELLVLLGEPVE